MFSFTKENTEFDIEVSNWEEAIIQTGTLLEENGYASENYKYSIIKDVLKYGSYIMLSPGIVIPHTRPENGSKEIGFVFLTVKNDVYFNDNKKDPIKILIGFTAKDNDNHIEMLQMIIKIITEGLVDKLDYFLKLNEESKLKYLNKFI
ncbi:MAG: PTS sugar transporter subunit IIA [Tissierellia bacterium]|nr:PTS sugar transporter subunit IIA [Tissierellia bacterium]